MTQPININKLISEIIEDECKNHSQEIKAILNDILYREMCSTSSSLKSERIVGDYDKIFKKRLDKESE